MISRILALVALAAAPTSASFGQPVRSEISPNFVIIFLDDAGYGDFAAFNPNVAYPTPNVDRLAEEGCFYRNFYVPQAICSASRSALLTGAYPGRTGVFGAYAPKERGLDPKFKILPEVLKPAGYTSGLFGKWHLGDQPETRPHARGFDQSSGLMYSNDMWEHHPTDPERWGRYPLQYWKNGDIIDQNVDASDQKELTRRATEDAVNFIEQNADNPFFLYLAHPMPHVPLFCSEAFEGQSGAGLYGDVIMELDWSVGQVDAALKRVGVADNTMLIFTSDNGPWLLYGEHAGYTPFREAKRTSFDGGTRSACLIRFPGRIEAGSESSRAFSSIDLLPTIIDLAGAPAPESPIDGMNQWGLISGDPDAENPQPYYAFTTTDQLEAIMTSDGRWKLHLPHRYHTVVEPGRGGEPGKAEHLVQPMALYDLENDPDERRNLIEAHPDIAAKLQAWAQYHLEKFPKLSQPKIR